MKRIHHLLIYFSLTGTAYAQCPIPNATPNKNQELIKGISVISDDSSSEVVISSSLDNNQNIPIVDVRRSLNHVPNGIVPNLRSIINCFGKNRKFVGCSGGYFQVMDNKDVSYNNKGVLYGISIDIYPRIERKNAPFDDANGLIIHNIGQGMATEGIYSGHNKNLDYDWKSVIGIASNAKTGIYFSGRYLYGISFSNSMNFVSNSSAAQILFSKPKSGNLGVIDIGNDTFTPSNNVSAVQTDSNGNWIFRPSIKFCKDDEALGACAQLSDPIVVESSDSTGISFINKNKNQLFRMSVDAGRTNNLQIGSVSGTGLVQFLQPVKLSVGRFSDLPMCNAGSEGSLAGITDGSTSVYNAFVRGGGTTHVKVYCNGRGWVVG